MFSFLVILLTLFGNIKSDEILTNSGGFVFEKVATNHLNQDFMTFTRQLDFNLLQPLVDNLQGLLNLHGDICDKAQTYTTDNSTVISRDGTKIEHHGFIQGKVYSVNKETSIFIPQTGRPEQTNSVCLQNSARLPEPTLDNLQAIREICTQKNLYKIPIGVTLNSYTSSLVYDSNLKDVPISLFDQVSFFNDHTDKTYSIKTLNETIKAIIKNPSYITYLSACNSHSPKIQFVGDAHQGIGPIVCEKPNTFLQNIDSDISSSFLYKWVHHACKRDHPELTSHVEHAKTELLHILDYQLHPQKLLRYANYYPQFSDQFSDPNPQPAGAQVTLINSPGNSLISIQQDEPIEKVRKPRHTQNVTIFEPDQFPLDSIVQNLTMDQTLSLLHLTNETLRNKLYVYSNSDKPTEEQIFNFLCSHPLDTDSNMTLTLVRDKRTAGIHGSFLGSIVVGIYSLVKYIENYFNYDYDLLQLNTEPLATVKQLHHVNGLIANLTIEQNEIKKSINKGSALMKNTRQELTNHMIAMTMSTAQIDTKTSIYFALQIVSSFIAKLANILLGAQTGTTSIYALNKFDLLQISNAVTLQNSGIALTSKLSDVKTELISFDSSLTLRFTIPIVSPATLFNFYKVIPIPIFQKDTTLIPDTTFTNIAVSNNQMYYTTLSEQEFTTCVTTNSLCRTHFPMKFLSSRYDCVLTAFLDKTANCTYKQIPVTPYPFFYFHDLHAVYSVPRPTTIRSTCIDSKGSRTQSASQIVSVGNLHFPPNCKIVTTDTNHEFHYNTPTISETATINDWHTFDNMKYLDIPDKTVIQLYEHMNQTLLDPTVLTIPTWHELLRDSVSLKKVLPTWAQVLVLAILLIGIFFLGKYLNNITCCDAVKGASHRRLQHSFHGFFNWMNKRADYFHAMRQPPVPAPAPPFDVIHTSFRHLQNQAQSHLLSSDDAKPIFRSGHLQAQEDRETMQYAARVDQAKLLSQSRVSTAKIIPNPPSVYVEPEQAVVAPVTYGLPQRNQEKVHKYNTRAHRYETEDESEDDPRAPSYPIRQAGFQFN